MGRCSAHPLEQAHSPAPSASGTKTYVICAWMGCPQRRQLSAYEWQEEVRRRSSTPPPRTQILRALERGDE